MLFKESVEHHFRIAYNITLRVYEKKLGARATPFLEWLQHNFRSACSIKFRSASKIIFSLHAISISKCMDHNFCSARNKIL